VCRRRGLAAPVLASDHISSSHLALPELRPLVRVSCQVRQPALLTAEVGQRRHRPRPTHHKAQGATGRPSPAKKHPVRRRTQLARACWRPVGGARRWTIFICDPQLARKGGIAAGRISLLRTLSRTRDRHGKLSDLAPGHLDDTEKSARWQQLPRTERDFDIDLNCRWNTCGSRNEEEPDST
jgi:hypothetical protein